MPEKAVARCKGSVELCWNLTLHLVCIYLEVVLENKRDSQALHAMTGGTHFSALELVRTNATTRFQHHRLHRFRPSHNYIHALQVEMNTLLKPASAQKADPTLATLCCPLQQQGLSG
jgi:hypothetical protein